MAELKAGGIVLGDRSKILLLDGSDLGILRGLFAKFTPSADEPRRAQEDAIATSSSSSEGAGFETIAITVTALLSLGGYVLQAKLATQSVLRKSMTGTSWCKTMRGPLRPFS